MSLKLDLRKKKIDPDHKTTLDWNKIRSDYENRLQWEQDQGLNPVELRHLNKSKPEVVTNSEEEVEVPKKRRSNNPNGVPAKYDHQKMFDLHCEGLDGTQIARQLNCNKSTVYGVLKNKFGVTFK